MKKLNSLNFNLREPHARRPTPIYAVVRIDSRQVKIPLGAKIEPWRWDKLRQIPILNGDKNYLFIFDTISRLRLLFAKNFLYVCNVHFIINQIRKEISNMANEQNLRHCVTRTPKATTLLYKAFELYYSEKQVKESTVTEAKKLLKNYYTYCQEIGKDKMSMLCQSGLNAYRDYLVADRAKKEKQGGKVRLCCNLRINNKCEVVTRLINFMASHTAFAKYCDKIHAVKYRPLQEVKTKGEHKLRRPLTAEELQAITVCGGLTPYEQEYRDLFIVQCECGCRASDLWKLFDISQQEHYTKDGQEAIIVNTQKENIKAVIMLTPIIKEAQEKYKNGFKYVKIRSKSFVTCYDTVLKRIFRSAGLNTIEQYIDAFGVIQNKPLHEIINSHFARYTFVKNCIAKGLSPDEIKDLTGHADAKMVNQVYSVITAKDKASNAFKALERVSDNEVKFQSDNAANEPRQSTALTTYVMHCRDILAWYGEPRESYADIRDPRGLARLIATRYEVPLANMGWDVEAIERLYKDDDTEGYKRLKADIKRLRL